MNVVDFQTDELSLVLDYATHKIVEWASAVVVWNIKTQRKWNEKQWQVLHADIDWTTILKMDLQIGKTFYRISHPSKEQLQQSIHFSLQQSPCKCCFEIVLNQRDPISSQVWCRFINCQQFSFPTRGCQHLFSRVDLEPSTIEAQKLIFFKTTTTLDLEPLSNCKGLRELNIFSCSTSAHLPYLPDLQYVCLEYCNDITNIDQLEFAQELKHLEINWCDNIHSIQKISHHLLRTLSLQWCKKLHTIFDLDCPSLKRLTLQACPQFSVLPILSKTQNIEHLHISWFSQKIDIPDLTHLTKLRSLRLLSLNHLIALPKYAHEYLERIDISDCNALKQVVIQGQRLRQVIANGCTSLEQMDISKANNIHSLSLARVNNFEELIGLENNNSLQSLHISNAPKITELNGLQSNFDLRSLVLINCCKIKYLPEWRRLIQLQTLEIYGCDQLQSLPSIKLPSLEVLHIGGCSQLTSIPSFDFYPNLRFLKLSWTHSQHQVLDLSNLHYLHQVKISGSQNLEEIRGLEKLQLLQELDLSRCKSLKKLMGLGQATQLRKIQLQSCESLQDVPGLFHLKQLEDLSISYCFKITHLDFLYYHPKLHILDIASCKNLLKFPRLHMETKQALQILNCSNLDAELDLSKIIPQDGSSQLQEINVNNAPQIYNRHILESCPNLTEIIGVSAPEKWAILFKIAAQRHDEQWLMDHWEACMLTLQQHPTHHQLINSCIFSMKVILDMTKTTQLFEILRMIEHDCLGDSHISDSLWYDFFEMMHHSNRLIPLFANIYKRQNLKINLNREENWFPVLIDLCIKQGLTSVHAELLERIYQECLYRDKPMFHVLRAHWLVFEALPKNDRSFFENCDIIS